MFILIMVSCFCSSLGSWGPGVYSVALKELWRGSCLIDSYDSARTYVACITWERLVGARPEEMVAVAPLRFCNCFLSCTEGVNAPSRVTLEWLAKISSRRG